jgi:hypothetical protein
VEKYGTDRQATDGSIIQLVRIACLMIMATDTYSEYVTLIALRPQQSANERASVVHYKYTVHLVVLLEHLKLWGPEKLKPSWLEGKMKKRHRHK